MGKQLIFWQTLSLAAALFFYNLQSRARTHAILVIGWYELLGNLLSLPNSLSHYFVCTIHITLAMPLQVQPLLVNVLYRYAQHSSGYYRFLGE